MIGAAAISAERHVARRADVRGCDVRAVIGSVSLLFAAAMTADACLASSLEETEKAALAATVADFNAAMIEPRYERLVDTIPPRMLAWIAKQGGATVEQIRPAMVELMKTLLASVKIESFSMALDRAEHRELPSGTPYALIPTTTVLDLGDKGRFEEKSYTVALLDEGKWYLVRVGDAQQLVIMREVYPEFTGIEIPRGSMEALKK